MSLKDIFKKAFNEKGIGDDENWNFVLALVAILLGSALVNLWIRVINNFAYSTLGLSKDSFFWALLIALFFTTVLIVYIIIVLDDNVGKAVKQNMTGITILSAVPAINSGMIDLNQL
jgi:ABC-type uncharacterized transport system fused permease/ATPase subunit